MNTTGDDEPQGDQETWSPAESLSIEQLARTAPFPVYGLVQTPHDLTLHGIGYSTAGLGVGHPTPPSPSNPPQVHWQVSLIYGYPPGHPDVSPRLELITTSTTRSPVPVPTIEDLVRASATHYQSDDEVPPLGSQAASFLIERFAVINGQAVAIVAYTPDAPPLTLLPGDAIGIHKHEIADASAPHIAPMTSLSVVTPDWSFAFRNAEMWVEARAYGWTQTAIFPVLHQLATISDKPDVLARYYREMIAWERSRIHPNHDRLLVCSYSEILTSMPVTTAFTSVCASFLPPGEDAEGDYQNSRLSAPAFRHGDESRAVRRRHSVCYTDTVRLGDEPRCGGLRPNTFSTECSRRSAGVSASG